MKIPTQKIQICVGIFLQHYTFLQKRTFSILCENFSRFVRKATKYEKSCGAVVFTKENNIDTVKQIVYFLAEYKNQNVKFQKSELSAVKLLALDEAYNTFEYESSKRILSAAYDHLS